MAISLQTLKRNDRPRPPVTLLYGKPGVGKTTFASFAPNPIFLMSEDGLVSPHLSKQLSWDIKSMPELMEALNVLGRETHDFKTIVLDSLDQYDPLVTKAMCEHHGWADISAPGYGKGQVEIIAWWQQVLTLLFALRNFRDMGVFMLGHHRQANVTPPDNPPYTQFTLTLPEKTTRLLVGEADVVAFATHPVHTVTQAGKFGQNTTLAVSDASGPVLHLQERGSHIAKNRYDMPPTIPMNWNAFASLIPYYRDLLGAPGAMPTAQMNGAVQAPGAPA